MNSRDRFTKMMKYESVDRPPLFEDGIRDEVLRVWRTQGMSKKDKLNTLFSYDQRDEIEPDLEPSPSPAYWPTTIRD
jgi:hypothetical protein